MKVGYMFRFSLRTLFIFVLVSAVAIIFCLSQIDFYWSRVEIGYEKLESYKQLMKSTNASTHAVFLDTEFHQYYYGNSGFEDYCIVHWDIYGSRPFLLLTGFNDPGNALSEKHFKEIGAFSNNLKGPGGTGGVVWVRDGKAIGFAHVPSLKEFEAKCRSFKQQKQQTWKLTWKLNWRWKWKAG